MGEADKEEKGGGSSNKGTSPYRAQGDSRFQSTFYKPYGVGKYPAEGALPHPTHLRGHLGCKDTAPTLPVEQPGLSLPL